MTNTVLVTIPAYNEEENIATVVTSVKTLYPSFDVLVVNDGSDDNTESEALKSGARVISLPFHVGGRVAAMTSYLVALKNSYDYLVKIDGDGQHNAKDILAVLEPVQAKKADICVGSRYLLNGKHDDKDSIVKMGGRAFSSIVMNSLVKDLYITDVTSGLRAWNRRALKVLLDSYLKKERLPDISVLWLFETVLASRNGLKLTEVPITVLPRLHGKSKSFSMVRMVKYPVNLFKLLLRAI